MNRPMTLLVLLMLPGAAACFSFPSSEEAGVSYATADGTPDLSVALPAGWWFEERSLAGPLVLHPFGTGDECFYNIIRDAKEQAYHQYEYAGASYP